MTTPPGPPYEFGPTGEVPDDNTQQLALPGDTQRVTPRGEPHVPYRQPDTTQPVSIGLPSEPWRAEPASVSSAVWAETAATSDGNTRRVLIWLALGALVAVALGVYGRVHEPTGEALNIAGFSSGLHAKAWLSSTAFLLAIVQVLTASAMWGRLPGVRAGGRGVSAVHRWSGRAAVVVSLPVAAHCLYALGFQGFDVRVLIHSLLGCFFYGVFVFKMLALSRDHRPGWLLPVVGAAVFTGLTGLWLTSALWFFTEFGVSW
ncbi:DUF6529 family protein [Actinophytocola sp.]|uniref:DUF6529 family protein n=1 Tax=Actinophytocola sp. TaxID=1872138 RepID=UPI002ED638A3